MLLFPGMLIERCSGICKPRDPVLLQSWFSRGNHNAVDDWKKLLHASTLKKFSEAGTVKFYRFFLNFCTVFFRNFRHKIILKFLPGVTIFAHFFQMFSGYSRCMVPWNKEYLLLHQDWRGWKPRQPEGRHQPIFRSVYLSHVGEHHHLGDAPIRAFYGLYLPSFSGQQAKSGQKWGKNLWNSLIFCPFYVGEM